MSPALLILGCACGQAPAPATIPPDQFLALIRREAAPKWASYSALTQECEITCRREIRQLGPNGDLIPDHPGNRVIDETCILQKNCGLLRESVTRAHPVKKKNNQRVDCFNSRYSFELQGFTADALALRNITNPTIPEDEIARTIRGAVTSRCGGWLLSNKPLHELLADPKYTTEAVRRTPRGNYIVPFVLRANGATVRYEIELNPERGWRIETDKSVRDEHVDQVFTMSYEGEEFPVPIPNRTVYDETDRKTGKRFQVITTASQFRSNPKRAEEEFTLSAFGMPEPVGVTWERPTPRYVWFLVAAGGFAALMLGFRYLARRRTPKPAVPA